MYLQYHFVHRMEYNTLIKLERIGVLEKLPRASRLNKHNPSIWNMPYDLQNGVVRWSKIQRGDHPLNICDTTEPGEYDIMVDPIEIIRKYHIDLR